MRRLRGLDLTDVDDRFRKRFWDKVDQRGADECWPWLAYIKPEGYGQFTLRKGVFVTASRVSLGLTIGRALRPEEVACHRCDNPPCCNPNHLFVGTHFDNSLDCIKKGRARRARGEAQGASKLTEGQVREILAEPNQYGLVRFLARKHGVSDTTIRGIRSRRLWSHLDAEVNTDELCTNGHLLAGANRLPVRDPSKGTFCAICAEAYRVSRLRTREAA